MAIRAQLLITNAAAAVVVAGVLALSPAAQCSPSESASGRANSQAQPAASTGVTAGAEPVTPRLFPPERLSTTLSIDGSPGSVSIFGKRYSGVRITHVGDSGIGKAAGIEPTDVLLSLNSRPILNAEQADEVLNSLPSGNLEVVFARNVNGKYRIIENRLRFINPYRQQPEVAKQLPSIEPGDPRSLEERMVQLINMDRAQAAAHTRPGPVKHEPALSDVARRYAEEMVRRNFFGHEAPDGKGPRERLAEAGVSAPFAENLLRGAVSIEEAQQEFMNEPPNDPHNHRGNILNPQFRFVGVGVARAEDESLVVVQLFSRDPPRRRPGASHTVRLP